MYLGIKSLYLDNSGCADYICKTVLSTFYYYICKTIMLAKTSSIQNFQNIKVAINQPETKSSLQFVLTILIFLNVFCTVTAF